MGILEYVEHGTLTDTVIKRYPARLKDADSGS